jgi:hypothetical protein
MVAISIAASFSRFNTRLSGFHVSQSTQGAEFSMNAYITMQFNSVGKALPGNDFHALPTADRPERQ